LRQKNRLSIQNYVEIYIKSNLSNIIKVGKKKLYQKYNKNVVGKDILAELPKSPDIILNNEFDKSVKMLAKQLLNKIKEVVKN